MNNAVIDKSRITTSTSSSSASSSAVAASSSVGATELFGIFPNNGWIYLRGSLDRETCDLYNITVLASDNGTPSASATTHVIVNVLDANDNDPIFSRATYEFTVEENVRRGTIVGVLLATDLDLGINAEIRYNLIPNNTSFQVNPNTG